MTRYGTYNADTLAAKLRELEAKYELSSEEHYRLRYSEPLVAGLPAHISRFDSFVWADIYLEYCDLLEKQVGL